MCEHFDIEKIPAYLAGSANWQCKECFNDSLHKKSPAPSLKRIIQDNVAVILQCRKKAQDDKRKERELQEIIG